MERNIELDCKHCGTTLQISVPQRYFGHRVEINCQACGQSFDFTVPREETPSPLNEKDQADLARLQEVINEALSSDKVAEVIAEMTKNGARVALSVELRCFFPTRRPDRKLSEVTPKVDSKGEVVKPLSPSDQALLKKAGIEW